MFFQVSHLSLRLTYRIAEAEFQSEVVESVRKAYGLDIGKGCVYSVFVSFRAKGGWTDPFWMIYDTGAAVSLLPLRFFDILGVRRYASIKLMGISPDIQIWARLTRARLRFIDVKGKRSPEIEAWVAIAERNDVPLIIGLKDIADKHSFSTDPKLKQFYLTF